MIEPQKQSAFLVACCGVLQLVEYEEGRVVSRTFAQNPSLSLTLFAFDKGEGVSTHTAPGDAMVRVLDGEATVNIDGKKMTVNTGQVVVMPANVPHKVTAVKRFKIGDYIIPGGAPLVVIPNSSLNS